MKATIRQKIKQARADVSVTLTGRRRMRAVSRTVRAARMERAETGCLELAKLLLQVGYTGFPLALTSLAKMLREDRELLFQKREDRVEGAAQK